MERERFIHKYLLVNVRYKYNCSEDNFVCHTIVESFLYKLAVCDGMSKAFKQLCDLARINCNVVFGDSWDEYEKPQKNAWNMVKIDMDWYHIDVTWDINLLQRFKYVRYNYFDIRESDVIKDHRNFDKLEICDGLKNNFFYVNKFILNVRNELEIFLVDKLNNIKNNNASKNVYFKLYLEENEDAFSLISNVISKASIKTFYFSTGYTLYSNSTQVIYLIRLYYNVNNAEEKGEIKWQN